MDYADSQSGLRSVSTSIPRYTGMERGGAINLVFDDSVSTFIQCVRTYTACAVTYDGRGVAFSGDLHTFTLLYWSKIQKTRRVRGDYLVPTVGGYASWKVLDKLHSRGACITRTTRRWTKQKF